MKNIPPTISPNWTPSERLKIISHLTAHSETFEDIGRCHAVMLHMVRMFVLTVCLSLCLWISSDTPPITG